MKNRRLSRWAVAWIVFAAMLIGAAAWTLYDTRVDRSGWRRKNDSYYYLNFHGRKVTGWRVIDGYTFYFRDDHKMVRGWQDVDGVYRHFDQNGILSVGWKELDGEWLYFGSDGVPLTGWQDISEKRYYFDDEGIAQIGWRELDGERYYFLEKGEMATGWQEIDDERYYFIDYGTPLTGPAILEEGAYYFLDNGMMHTGWIDRNGQRYFYGADGVMTTGWLETGGKRFFFGKDGTMQHGWVTVGEYTCYLQEDGSAAVGPMVIDGQKYYFSPKGLMVVLVNRNNPIPRYYQYDLVTFVEWYQVQRVASDPLQRMLDACVAAGYEYEFNSSYRSQKDQTDILEARTAQYMVRYDMPYDIARAEALKTVALPGTSEHQLGLSVDIVGEEAHVWLAEHCWEYGFILRYPADKSEITGIDNEPWHFRYVGLDVSMDMKDSGLCLEEYLGAV